MDYKKLYNKFNITHELLVNRYMLATLMTNIYALMDAVQSKERTLAKLIDKKTYDKIVKTQKATDTIEFQYFSITNKQYQALINEYGVEVVTNACVILDKYLRDLGRPLKDPYQKLKQWAVNLAMKERLSEYTSEITKQVTNMDYKLIDNETTARQYIAGIPFYLRTVDEGCKYLTERFNLYK